MPEIRRTCLRQVVRFVFAVCVAAAAARTGFAQNAPQVSLETSETLFTILTAINTCGYDQELNTSGPLRKEIRSEVARAVENTAGAPEVVSSLCAFYRQ